MQKAKLRCFLLSLPKTIKSKPKQSDSFNSVCLCYIDTFCFLYLPWVSMKGIKQKEQTRFHVVYWNNHGGSNLIVQATIDEVNQSISCYEISK